MVEYNATRGVRVVMAVVRVHLTTMGLIMASALPAIVDFIATAILVVVEVLGIRDCDKIHPNSCCPPRPGPEFRIVGAAFPHGFIVTVNSSGTVTGTRR